MKGCALHADKSRFRLGFTLFEMMVVLVVIGLVMGAMFIGRDLYIAARGRGIVKEANLYKQAFAEFRIKYDQLPGDLKNPADYWPAEAQLHAGNGNGLIVWSSEGPAAWRELQLAGFINNPIVVHDPAACPVVGEPGRNCYAKPGVNIPGSSAITGAGWTIALHKLTVTNALYFGAFDGVSIATLPILSSLEAFAIDSKIDDGIAGRGTMRARDTPTYSYCTANNAYTMVDDVNCSFSIELGH